MSHGACWCHTAKAESFFPLACMCAHKHTGSHSLSYSLTLLNSTFTAYNMHDTLSSSYNMLYSCVTRFLFVRNWGSDFSPMAPVSWGLRRYCRLSPSSAFADLSLLQSVRKHVLLYIAQLPVGGRDTPPPDNWLSFWQLWNVICVCVFWPCHKFIYNPKIQARGTQKRSAKSFAPSLSLQRVYFFTKKLISTKRLAKEYRDPGGGQWRRVWR
jgi:hypothetical protein